MNSRTTLSAFAFLGAFTLVAACSSGAADAVTTVGTTTPDTAEAAELRVDR